jgi:glyoxylase-like metal-dependent hydrolase (beta-lactamase superfamily II)
MPTLKSRLRDDASPTEIPFKGDLAVIRRLSAVIPGALPLAINGVRFAASIRPRKFVIAGGDETPVSMPRTAFQVVYPDATLMLDAGMDKATHDSFGEGEPFYQSEFERLQRALNAARLIVLTHYHADHVAGVLQAPNFAELAGKTIVTTETLRLMMEAPHRPHLKLTAESAREFITLDYNSYYPVAPGVVLIKAPGHSPDMQMVYIRLQSGQEYLHSVDAAWNMANIQQVKGKAAPWVKEDAAAILGQLRWLNRIGETEKNVTILVTHDDELFKSLTRQGVLGSELQ